MSQALQWYLAVEGKQIGPLSADEVARRLESGAADAQTLCWTGGMAGWMPLASVPAFNSKFASSGDARPRAIARANAIAAAAAARRGLSSCLNPVNL